MVGFSVSLHVFTLLVYKGMHMEMQRKSIHESHVETGNVYSRNRASLVYWLMIEIFALVFP